MQEALGGTVTCPAERAAELVGVVGRVTFQAHNDSTLAGRPGSDRSPVQDWPPPAPRAPR